MTINTACSASLVALSLACCALKNGTIEGAVVGGGCLQLSPLLTEMMAVEGTLSADGSCKSFDANANGFARAEGITAIYIKRLEDAVRDGNAIRSIIRGCGTNSDGNRAGLMQPQARTQEVLMRQIYADAGLNPAETSFVEVCHQLECRDKFLAVVKSPGSVTGLVLLSATLSRQKQSTRCSEITVSILGFVKSFYVYCNFHPLLTCDIMNRALSPILGIARDQLVSPV